MTKDFEVFYLETREKSSSIHSSKQELSIESLGKDLPYVLSENNLINKPYTMFGSSLGATVILDAISKNKLSPTNVILIGPNAEFNIPLIWLLITRFTPAFFFYLLKPVVKWYMKKKYLDMESSILLPIFFIRFKFLRSSLIFSFIFTCSKIAAA